MPETQQDIDALLAEVNALAEEAVASISGTDAFAPASASGGPVAPPVAMAAAPGRDGDPQVISRSIKSGRIATGGASSVNEDVTRILKIEVPIIVQLSERTMPLAEILNLTTGSIIEFDKPADSELELRVNNKCVGSGQAVKVGENFGLRVARVGSIRERIQAMGGG